MCRALHWRQRKGRKSKIICEVSGVLHGHRFTAVERSVAGFSEDGEVSKLSVEGLPVVHGYSVSVERFA